MIVLNVLGTFVLMVACGAVVAWLAVIAFALWERHRGEGPLPLITSLLSTAVVSLAAWLQNSLSISCSVKSSLGNSASAHYS
jgi:hypothetical protein